MTKIKKHFEKGDVIITNPEEGHFGIAVVLSYRDKTDRFLPMCHIAITPLLFTYEVSLEDVDLNGLKPLCFKRTMNYIKRGKSVQGVREDLMITIYSTRNKAGLKVIGNIDTSSVYNGELLWEPQENKFHFGER
ncbi:hypothetical protein G7059_08705 [Erysipelothrix sp. HDW6A]|uniref:hypothetical protein n=1 Tax=Erysipelothrix sp. HDW6A TaxID=2714928 RepID=UPI001409467B|nr:hypothetical protein [Erysipelothrix sp. HDW6A]QIK57915.1 hypothetical protein G7059_08705 [Erysipelothrix sp. HDW6A]